MTLAEATTIVLQMAEAKWYRHWFGCRKTTKEQDQAIRILSAYIEHCRFPDGSIGERWKKYESTK